MIKQVMNVLKNPIFAYAIVIVLVVVIATKKKCECPVCEEKSCDCTEEKKVSFSDSVELIDTTQSVGPAGVEAFSQRRRR